MRSDEVSPALAARNQLLLDVEPENFGTLSPPESEDDRGRHPPQERPRSSSTGS